MLPALSYARVSSADQDKGRSVQTQHSRNRAYAEELGYTIVGEYSDVQSGAVVTRIGLEQTLERLSREGITALFVLTADRIIRNQDEWPLLRRRIQAVAELFWSGDRRMVAREGVDKLLDNIQIGVAELEKDKIRERAVRNMWGKVRDGKPIASGAAPFGYRYEGTRRERALVLDEDAAAVVQSIFAWYVSGLGVRDICRKLMALGVPTPEAGSNKTRKRAPGEWSPISVYRILHRSAYVGQYEQFQTKRVPRTDDPNKSMSVARDKDEWAYVELPPELRIIDAQTWAMTQRRLKEGRARASRNSKRVYLLARMLKCSCGWSMQARHTTRTGITYYGCVSRNQTGTRKTACEMPYLRADLLEPNIWCWAETHLFNPEWIEAAMRAQQRRGLDAHRESRDRVAAIEATLEKFDSKLANLTELFLDADTEAEKATLKQRRSELRRQRAEAEEELRSEMAQAQRVYSEGEIARTVEQVQAYQARLADITLGQARRLLEVVGFWARLRLVGDGTVAADMWAFYDIQAGSVDSVYDKVLSETQSTFIFPVRAALVIPVRRGVPLSLAA